MAPWDELRNPRSLQRDAKLVSSWALVTVREQNAAPLHFAIQVQYADSEDAALTHETTTFGPPHHHSLHKTLATGPLDRPCSTRTNTALSSRISFIHTRSLSLIASVLAAQSALSPRRPTPSPKPKPSRRILTQNSYPSLVYCLSALAAATTSGESETVCAFSV